MSELVRSGKPFHRQIAQVLKARLESGEWAVGDAPTTELGLCEEFGASRTTVRLALSQLKDAGLLESRAGVGTRGIAPPIKKKIVRSSGDPLHAGLNARPRIAEFGIVPSPAAVATFFDIPAGSPIWHFVRIYELEKKPLSVVDSYLPAHLGSNLTRTMLRQPMHELLWQQYGMRLHRSVHSVRVARADLAIASLLGVALADPVLRIQSSVFLADGKPIRWTWNYFDEDRYEYVAEMEWPAPTGKRATTSKSRPVGK